METFGALVERTRATALEAFAHQDLPFERLVEELAPDRDTGQTPLFQVMIVHGMPPSASALGELEVSPLHLASPVSKFDLDFAFAEVEEGLEGWLTWSTDLFDSTTALRLLERFDHWLALVAEDDDQPLAGLPLLTPAQTHQALVEWNEATVPKVEDPLLHVFSCGELRNRRGRRPWCGERNSAPMASYWLQRRPWRFTCGAWEWGRRCGWVSAWSVPLG